MPKNMTGSSNQSFEAQPPSFPQFDGENYDFLCVKMKTQLISNDLWEYVEDGYDDPEDVDSLTDAQKQILKAHKRKDARALSMIQQGVSDKIFSRIINETKAKDAWDILQKEYRGNLKVRAIKLQSLRRDFENMKMKDGEVLQDYFSRLMEVVNQMKIHGDNITNERIVGKILITLTADYNPIVEVLENTKNIETLSVEELMGSIKSFEQKIE